MNRVEAAANARRARAAKRATSPSVELVDQSIQRDIIALRSQVASEINKRRFTSGIQLYTGDIDEEYVSNLKTLSARTRVFERMSNDPHIRGQLRAIYMTLISGVRWKADGGTSRARALVEANLLRKGPRALWCATSWLQFLYEALGCLIYGFSIFAKSWGPPVEGRQYFSDLQWLHPRSIDEDGWMMDDADNFLGVHRSYSDGQGGRHTRVEIPARDLFLICWDRRGPNWEGNAFIRSMYKPWILKETAEKIDIIDLQNRGIGIPMAKLSGAGGAKERDTLIEILKSLRGGSKERAFIVVEKEEEVSYLTSQGAVKDARGIQDYHNQGIVKAAGTEYFEQGNTATGSRAGASALATGFFLNVDGIRVLIEDMINQGTGPLPGLVEELVEKNFGPDEDCPRIIGSRVSPTEQLDNIPLIQDAIQKGVAPPTLKWTNEMARRLGWPELTEKEWKEAKTAGPIVPSSPAVGGAGRPAEAGPDEQGRDDRDGRRFGLSDAEKKTDTGAIRLQRRPESWPWLRSTAG